MLSNKNKKAKKIFIRKAEDGPYLGFMYRSIVISDPITSGKRSQRKILWIDKFYMAVIIICAASWEKWLFAYAKTKTQISFAVTAKLMSIFVFATWIVQSLFFLNSKFQASSYLLWLHSLVCVGPGQKPRRPVFSQRSSYNVIIFNLYSKSSKDIILCIAFYFKM